MNNNDEHRYDYMLNMPHHRSKKRKPMTITERAAQFGAFRALTGYEAAISETSRLTENKIELDENIKSELDMKLRFLVNQVDKLPVVTIKYFESDKKKCGGKYVTFTGAIKRILSHKRQIVFNDGKCIDIDDIIDIDAE